jgi:hypothetical protein
MLASVGSKGNQNVTTVTILGMYKKIVLCRSNIMQTSPKSKMMEATCSLLVKQQLYQKMKIFGLLIAAAAIT